MWLWTSYVTHNLEEKSLRTAGLNQPFHFTDEETGSKMLNHFFEVTKGSGTLFNVTSSRAGIEMDPYTGIFSLDCGYEKDDFIPWYSTKFYPWGTSLTLHIHLGQPHLPPTTSTLNSPVINLQICYLQSCQTSSLCSRSLCPTAYLKSPAVVCCSSLNLQILKNRTLFTHIFFKTERQRGRQRETQHEQEIQRERDKDRETDRERQAEREHEWERAWARESTSERALCSSFLSPCQKLGTSLTRPSTPSFLLFYHFSFQEKSLPLYLSPLIHFRYSFSLSLSPGIL